MFLMKQKETSVDKWLTILEINGNVNFSAKIMRFTQSQKFIVINKVIIIALLSVYESRGEYSPV